MICWFKALWRAIKFIYDKCDFKREKQRSQGWEYRARPRKPQNAPIAAKITSLIASSAAKSQLINIPSQWFWGELKVDQVEPARRNKERFAQRFSEIPITKTMRKTNFGLTNYEKLCCLFRSFFVSIESFETKQPWYRTIYSHVLQLFTTNQAMQHKKLRLSSRRINFR